MYFGVISPKIKTAMVITTVEITEGFSEEFASNFVNKTVATAEDERFTMLFPIKIVEISLSKLFSDKCKTLAASRLPFAAIDFNLIRFTQEKAVSVAEKNADKISKAIKERSKGKHPDPSDIITPKK